jgi:hypothetical protein
MLVRKSDRENEPLVLNALHTVTHGNSDKLSEAEQLKNTELLTHYQSELLPETRTIYSEVSVYCWRTKVGKTA